MAMYLPGWCDKATGLPLSWRHFYYGIQILGRERARDTLRLFNVAAHAQSGGPPTQRWIDHTYVVAGWRDRLPEPGEHDHG